MLAPKAVLIVEREMIISISMQAALRDLVARPVIVLGDAAQFRACRISWAGIALAILEIERGRSDQAGLVNAAIAHNVPVLGLTADYRLQKGMPEFPGMPILVKPAPDRALVAAVTALLGTKAQKE